MRVPQEFSSNCAAPCRLLVKGLARLLSVQQQRGPSVDVGIHRIEFKAGVSEDDMRFVARAYEAEMHALLNERRMGHVQSVLGWGFIPPAFLFAAGWTVAWIRRGFRQPANQVER